MNLNIPRVQLSAKYGSNNNLYLTIFCYMAPVTVAILSLYSSSPSYPYSLLASTMVKFDPAVVSAATLGSKRYESVTLGNDSSAPTVSFPTLPLVSADC